MKEQEESLHLEQPGSEQETADHAKGSGKGWKTSGEGKEREKCWMGSDPFHGYLPADLEAGFPGRKLAGHRRRRG